jgi:hypothetical protein
MMLAVRRVLANMFLRWVSGPHRNALELREMTFPRVNTVANLTGFHKLNTDMKFIKMPKAQQPANPHSRVSNDKSGHQAVDFLVPPNGK